MFGNKGKEKHLINQKILAVAIIVIAIGLVLIVISLQTGGTVVIDKITGKSQSSQDYEEFVVVNEGNPKPIRVLKKDLLFNETMLYDKNNNFKSVTIEKRPELADFYRQVGFSDISNDTVFVYPIFTQAAYGTHGFYDYYKKNCGPECLTISIPDRFVPTYGASATISMVLPLLNYSRITDVDIDKNPDILKKYHKVLVLHNEYVTKNEFDAITSHPDVVYLFPNALYAEVRTNYTTNTFTLVRGHGYPISSVLNGFDWKFDNSNLEYNISCENMTFTMIPNGNMLNCYPAFRSLFDRSFLEAIKDL